MADTKPKKPFAVIGPSDTGTGSELGTQLYYCVEYLHKLYPDSIRRDDMAVRGGFEALYGDELFSRLIKHHSVRWDKKLELLRYKPEYDLQSADDVIAELRRWLPRGGMPVQTIRKSWPGCMPSLETLERQKKIRVIRTDGTAERDGQWKTIFLNQTPHAAELEQSIITGLLDGQTPDDPELINLLHDAGLQPAKTSTRSAAPAGKAKKKGAGKGRRIKVTNQHLGEGIDLTKDYVKPPAKS